MLRTCAVKICQHGLREYLGHSVFHSLLAGKSRFEILFRIRSRTWKVEDNQTLYFSFLENGFKYRGGGGNRAFKDCLHGARVSVYIRKYLENMAASFENNDHFVTRIFLSTSILFFFRL